MVLVLQSKLLKSSCLTMYLSRWIHSIIPQQQNFSLLIIFNNSLYIGSISTLSHDFEKKIMFPIYFIQQLQWIILKLLHYDTSQSCSILVTRMKKKMPKTKAFKDTIQKVTNVSPRQNVLPSVSIIYPKTKQQFADPIVNMNINKRKASHHLILKADETVMASRCIYSPHVTRCTWHQMTRICKKKKKSLQVPIFSPRGTSCNQRPFHFRKTVTWPCLTASFNSCSCPSVVKKC